MKRIILLVKFWITNLQDFQCLPTHCMERNIKINFDNAINRTLYRHQETVNTDKATPDAKLKDADATYLNVKDIVVDTVPAGSITVYTSIKG